MKKPKSSSTDDLRREYKREDLGTLVRGKYAARLKACSNVVVLTPEVAKAFPNSAAVNEVLTGLLELAKSAVRPTRRSTRTRAKAD